MRRAGRRGHGGPSAWSLVGVLFLIVMYGVPLLWLAATSLKDNRAIFANPGGIVFSPSFQAYAQIAREGTLGKAALNSAIISIGTTILTLLLGIQTAYGLDRVRGAPLTVGPRSRPGRHGPVPSLHGARSEAIRRRYPA